MKSNIKNPSYIGYLCVNISGECDSKEENDEHRCHSCFVNEIKLCACQNVKRGRRSDEPIQRARPSLLQYTQLVWHLL